MSDGPANDWAADLELALRAAIEAGRGALRWFRADPEVRHKSPDQPVTEADLHADALLAERLLRGRPGDGWLSEETSDTADRLGRDRVWIVDPIDGTRSFIDGHPEFAISVALVASGRAVVGVVYNPATNDAVWATRGGGAFRGRPAAGSAGGGETGAEGRSRLRMEEVGGPGASATPRPGREGRPGGHPVLLASRSELARGEFDGFREEWAVRPLGSTAWKLAGVATGAGDAYMSRGPKSEWDVVAGALVVEEAGGVVTDLCGRGLVYNRPEPYVHGIVAAASALHGRLLERAGREPAPRLE